MQDANSLPRTPVFVVGLFLAFALLLPVSTPAQTPVTTFTDKNGTVVFQSNADGGLLAPGVVGTGTIPATGAGTRLMWHPAKAALRAGEVTGSQWDDANVGKWSVAFGMRTTASGNSTVAMGRGAVAGANRAVAIGTEVIAQGENAVAIGLGNVAPGDRATALGDGTRASGQAATSMGATTIASGNQSFAAGQFAEAAHDNAFVWADGSDSDADKFSSGDDPNGSGVTGSQTFHAKASNGVRFITNGGTTYISGSSTGWSTTSTRTAKTDVRPVDPEAVLAALGEMPISTWEYKSGNGTGQGTRHIGPMAEAFHGALPYDLGSSKDHINAINADGVALGAIKGLAWKVKAQKKRLREQKKRIGELETRLSRLEAQVAGGASMPVGLLGSWTVGGLLLALGAGALLGGIFRRR